MAEANRLPWYSFLYRLLGAQGTFYLWLAAIITIWWTTKPAVVRMANRKPAPLAVADARKPAGLVRWVQLRGLEIELDRGLLQREEKATSPPVRMLLATEDPAAVWWLETRRLCVAASAGGAEDAKAVKARMKLIERRTQLAGEGRKDALPAPERAILLQDLSQTETRLPVTPRAKGNGIEDFQKALDAWIARVQERVRPDTTIEGVLDEAPQTVAERVKQELEVVPAPYLLQLDRRPRETESIVFGVSALILIFLGAGLVGAGGAGESTSDPEPAGGTPTPAETPSEPEPAPTEPNEASA